MSGSTSVQPKLIGGQLHFWIHLQIHFHLLPFGGPLHLWFQFLTSDDGGPTPSLDPSLVLSI